MAAGFAVVVVGAGLWFFFGRGSSNAHPSSSAAAATGSVAIAHKRKPENPIRRRAEDRAAQSELRNAFTLEKVVYTDNGAYSASVGDLKSMDHSIAWGTRVHVTVGDAASRGDHNLVCLSETTAGGDVFSIADVALGHQVGTYLGTKPCPSPLTAQNVSRLGSSFGA